MSRLIARILLSIFVFPLAAVLYIVVFFLFVENFYSFLYQGVYRDEYAFIFSGVVAWGFIGFYWWFLWRKDVRWTTERILFTFVAVVAAAVVGGVAGMATGLFDDEFGCFIGSVTAPLLWLVATVLIWRETTAERSARFSTSGKNALTCPTCGYNLTGLNEPRCPECGSRFTLDQLLAEQPWNKQEI